MPVPIQSVSPVEPWALGLLGGKEGQTPLSDVTAGAEAEQPPAALAPKTVVPRRLPCQ